MAADYDRLFQVPEELDGSQEAAAQSDYDVTSPSPTTPEPSDSPAPAAGPPTPPAHLVPPAPPPPPARPPASNGHARPPMPVERATRHETNGAAPPPVPVDRAQQTPLAQPGPPPQAPPQHGRHSRRAQREPGKPQDIHPREAPGAPLPPRAQAPAAPPAAPEPIPPRADQRDNLAVPRPDARSGGPQTEPPPLQPAGKVIPTRGWRRAFYLTTRINPGLSPREKHELELYTRIRRPLRGSYQIGVVGLKGGAGKTAVTAALGSVFAQVRGDRILAIDADQVAGNLVDRVGRQSSATIEELLANNALSHYNDVRAHTSSNAVNLEVLAAAEYRPARNAITDADWQLALTSVPRYYNLVLADCAADFFDPATRGVLSTASGLVIVCSVSVEGARQAEVAIEWLRQSRYRGLLNRACLVLNHVVVGEPGVAVRELVRGFEHDVPPGRVVVLPWDQHVAAGTEVDLDLLGGTFKRRIIALAAALSDDFDRGERR